MNIQEKNSQGEKGQAIVLLVLLIIGLIAITGLAVDGGRLYSARRAAQNAADNASLSGALALCTGTNVSSAAINSAASNGFNNDGVNSSVVVHNPPTEGSYVGNAEYVEVLVTGNIPATFARLVFSNQLTVTSRAVSHCNPESEPPFNGNGIIALDPDDNCSFRMNSNNAVLNVTDGGIQVNSTDNGALCVGNAQISASGDVSVVGGYDTGPNGSVTPTPSTGSPFVPDPLATLDPPARPGGTCTSYSLSSNSIGTINPGLYCSISVTGQAGLTMNPGVYYIEGGDFTYSGRGNLVANGVMIYLDAGSFDVSGGGNLEMSAPTSGQWEGMLLFMDQANTGNVEVTGGGALTVAGTIYAASADIILSGNGSGNTLYSQITGHTISIGGNGQLDVIYDPEQTFNPDPADLVEIVE